MKRLLLLAIFMIVALCANAQFLSGVELGGSLACSHQFREKGFANASADFRAYQRVTEWSRLRAEIGLSGVLPNGLDRYGYGVVGATLELRPLYAFGGFGLNCNPSGKRTIGMAFDCGVGLQVPVSSKWSVYSELAVSRICNARYWQTTHLVKAGVTYKL